MSTSFARSCTTGAGASSAGPAAPQLRAGSEAARDHLLPLEFTSKVQLLTALLETQMQGVCSQFGITWGEFEVLCAIGVGSEPVTPKALLSRLAISPAGLSNRLNRLELKGLVRRTTVEEDKRSMPVVLSTEGRSRALAARGACEEAEAALLAMVGDEVGGRIEHALALWGTIGESPSPTPDAPVGGLPKVAQPLASGRQPGSPTGAKTRTFSTPWPETGRELELLQCRLARDVEDVTPWAWEKKSSQREICGIFVSYGAASSSPGPGTLVCAAAVVMRGRDMVATSMGARLLKRSYRPGYLGLVVGPLLDDIVHALRAQPYVFFVNAAGRDHARGAGVAIQLGAAFDVPTIGITDRPIVAVGPEPPQGVGGWAPLEVDGRVVACRVRTAIAARPLTLHAGWRTSPEVARDCAASVGNGAPLPPQILRARHLACALRAEFLTKPLTESRRTLTVDLTA